MDDHTSASGILVWSRKMFELPLEVSCRNLYCPYVDLPNAADMRVSIRGAQRVGTLAGTPVGTSG